VSLQTVDYHVLDISNNS